MAPITPMLALTLLSCQIIHVLYVDLLVQEKKTMLSFTAGGLLSPCLLENSTSQSVQINVKSYCLMATNISFQSTTNHS